MIKQRTRRRQDSVTDAVAAAHSWDQSQGLYVPAGSNLFHGVEHPFHGSDYMVDYTGGSHRQFKDCYHVHTERRHFTGRESDLEPDVTFWTDNTPLGVAVTLPCPIVYKYTDTAQVANLNLTVKACDAIFALRNLETDIDFLRDPVDFGFSIWFLLRDILEIPKLIFSMSSFIGAITFTRRNTTLSQLANLNLSYSFGVKPFIQDLRDFIRILSKWTEAYDRLRKQMDQVYTWHSKPSVVSYSDPEGLSPLREFDLGPVSGLFGLTNLRANFVRGGLEITHRRAMQYSFRCPETTSFLARAKQLIDSLGILDPVAIWDLIPFSFIADWFGDWSGWLRRNLKPRLFKVDMVVHDYCESLLLKRVSSLFVDGFSTNLSDPPDSASLRRKLITLQTDVVYRRKRFRPPPSAIQAPTLKSFKDAVTPGKCKIALSLVAQRLPRGKHQSTRVADLL